MRTLSHPSPAASLRPRFAPRSQRRHRCFCSASASASGVGRSVVVLPGLGNATGDYDSFCRDLRAATGGVVLAARVSRPDWLRNAAGVVDVNYWRGTLNPRHVVTNKLDRDLHHSPFVASDTLYTSLNGRPTVDWYLDAITAAVQEARAASGQQAVWLVAHSAGGWLCRVWLQANPGEVGNVSVVSLGSPLRPPPTDVAGVIDQTRGILTYVAANCPGPADGVRWVCVAGRYIRGSESLSPDVNAWVVGQGYKQVCGLQSAWGDGITPTDWALLPGAEHVVLDGVFHSPVGADDSGRPWYGSSAVLPRWVHHLTGEPSGDGMAAAAATSALT